MKVTDDDVIAKLVEARTLIENPAHWTSGTAARDRNGDPVRPGVDEAECWCAVGALSRVVGRTTRAYHPLYERCRIMLYAAALETRSASPSGISIVNDRMGHAQTVYMFDRAIEIVREGGGDGWVR